MIATQPDRLTLDRLETPIGPITIATDDEGRLRAVDFFADEAGLRRYRHYQSLSPQPYHHGLRLR